MTVAKGDSHQTNPWAVCAHWPRGQTLVCDIRIVHEYSSGPLGSKSHIPLTIIPSLAIEKNRGNSTLTLYKLFTYSLDRFVCFELLIPLQNIGCK